jgi:Dyp-type peroxidase family
MWTFSFMPANNSPSKFPTEDLLEINDIQGNSLAGFNKDFQMLLFLKIHDREISKAWIRSIIPRIATVAEVLMFNNLFRALRNRQGSAPQGLGATWINIAFTYEGIQKLVPAKDAERFDSGDPFRIGMPTRSALLGDPTDPTAIGHPDRWVIGGTDASKYPDLVLIIASDDPLHLNAEVTRIKSSITALASSQGGTSGLEIIFEQPGATRPDLPGHEHFGFKDGISQPGVRGRVSKTAKDFFTARFLDPTAPAAARFAKPGQPLIWPGQFVLGYKMQRNDDPIQPQRPLKLSPSWTKNGSFLVFRRLLQDVPAFWNFMEQTAAKLSQKPGFATITPEILAAKFVGRWKSGAPLMRTPIADNPDLAKDSLANNHFAYGADTQKLPLIPIDGYPGDNFPPADSNTFGSGCPFAAHIRKVNPRDLGTDVGGASDTLTHQVLRRGIPFGSPLVDPFQLTAMELQEERGLLFISYQTSIENQFEFLSEHWANSELNPPIGGGHDPIIGQNQEQNDRTRIFELMGTDGSIETIEISIDWVIPTGGGYFFSPSIATLKKVFS